MEAVNQKTVPFIDLETMKKLERLSSQVQFLAQLVLVDLFGPS